MNISGIPRPEFVHVQNLNWKYAVSFYPPRVSGSCEIANYTVELFPYSGPGVEAVVTNTSVELTIPDPSKAYFGSVQARGEDGTYGQFSGVVSPDDLKGRYAKW